MTDFAINESVNHSPAGDIEDCCVKKQNRPGGKLKDFDELQRFIFIFLLNVFRTRREGTQIKRIEKIEEKVQSKKIQIIIKKNDFETRRIGWNLLRIRQTFFLFLSL